MGMVIRLMVLSKLQEVVVLLCQKHGTVWAVDGMVGDLAMAHPVTVGIRYRLKTLMVASTMFRRGELRPTYGLKHWNSLGKRHKRCRRTVDGTR